jgi:hypothetical protein
MLGSLTVLAACSKLPPPEESQAYFDAISAEPSTRASFTGQASYELSTSAKPPPHQEQQGDGQLPVGSSAGLATSHGAAAGIPCDGRRQQGSLGAGVAFRDPPAEELGG